MTATTIYQQLRAAGVQLDSHESDLYARVTPASDRIVAGYEHRDNVRRFFGDDGAVWYDIPFAFDPFWERACHGGVPLDRAR